MEEKKNEMKIKSQLFTLLYVMLGMVKYIVAFYFHQYVPVLHVSTPFRQDCEDCTAASPSLSDYQSYALNLHNRW